MNRGKREGNYIVQLNKRMVKYPFIQQHDEKDCSVACLSMICEFHGLKLPYTKVSEYIKVDQQGSSIYGIIKGAEQAGFIAKALQGNEDVFFRAIEDGDIQFPIIARIVDNNLFEHYIVVYEMIRGKMIIGNPAESRITRIPILQFVEQWQGEIIIFTPNDNFQVKNERTKALKKFYTYVLSQKKLIVTVFLISIIISLINILGAIIIEYVFLGAYQSSNDMDYNNAVIINEKEKSIKNINETFIKKTLQTSDGFNTVFVIIIFVFLVKSGLEIMRGYCLAFVTKSVDVAITTEYFDQLIELPMEFHETIKTGDLMARFNDISKIRDVVSMTILTIMLDAIMAGFCGALLFYINRTLFLITVIVIFVYTGVVVLFRNPIKKINCELMESGARIVSFFKEAIDGISTVKTYQWENELKNNFQSKYSQYRKLGMKGMCIHQIQNTLVSFFSSVGTVVLFWIGTYLCIAQMLQIPELFVYYYLLDYFLEPVDNLVNLQPELQVASVAAERINDIMQATNEKKENKKILNNLKCDIVLNNIYFRYGRRQLILQNVNMCFPQGKRIAIVGESGCGKTTLAKLLLAMYEPEKGHIMVRGEDLCDYSIESVRKHIAYIPQDLYFLSDTVYNNLRAGNKNISNDIIKDMCKMLGVSEVIEDLPLGYNTMLEEGGNNLSCGQKQRLAIARALLRYPDVLIMDEATSNLDTITEWNLKCALEEISADITWIIIAHRIRTIQSCDVIYVMKCGKVVEMGNHESLLRQKGEYYNMVYNDGLK